MKADIKEIREQSAEQQEAIREIRTQVGALGGKFDEFQYSAKGRNEELEQRLRTVSSRVPPPPGVPEELLNADDEAIGRISGPAADSYRAALLQIRSGDFVGASTALSAFVEANPGTAFTDNALYWLGICAEKQDQLNQAAVFYRDVYKRFPAEDRTPAALFRLGELFVKMGSREEASLALQKLIDEHPGTEYAARARTLLSTLGPKSRARKRS
jgi:tol-pal system protein YbgF